MTLPPDLQAELDAATFRELHPALLKAVASGHFTIIDLLDTHVWFRGAASWKPWRAFLKALYALPMDEEEFRIYQRATGRKRPPEQPALEVWCPTGRRARKSAIASVIAVFEGGFRDYTKYTAPGENPVIPLIGKNMEEAKQIATYCRALLADENLRWLLEDEEGEPGEETIKLRTGVHIRIRPATVTAGRGKTIPLGELDEVAFFATEGKAPDIEVVRGIRPGMATIPDAKLFAMSSPWAKRGMLYQATQDYYGAKNEDAANKDRVLVWWAPTLLMHDTPQIRGVIAEAFRKDPVAAESEYGTLDSNTPSPSFREDVEAYVLERIIDACMADQPVVRPPQDDIVYFAFTDVSGGSADSFTTAIAHYDLIAKDVVLDCILEQPAPFDPDQAVERHAKTLLAYGVDRTEGDKYAGRWPTTRFRKNHVTYELCEWTKSELYTAYLPQMNSGQVRLLNIRRIKEQFLDLERRVTRGSNKESIDHSTDGHDDVANAVAGACYRALRLGPTATPRAKVLPPAESTQEIMRRRVAEMTKIQKPNEDQVITERDYPYRR